MIKRTNEWFTSDYCAILLEINLQIFAKPARVVVNARFSVSERFQQRVHLLYFGVQAELERLGPVQ